MYQHCKTQWTRQTIFGGYFLFASLGRCNRKPLKAERWREDNKGGFLLTICPEFPS